MPVRKSWNINDINELQMLEFWMRGFEKGNDGQDILLIVGDNGWYNHYRVEIRFWNIAYIECPIFVDHDFEWKMATEEETRKIQEYAYKIPDAQVYCVDQRYDFDPPKKFFLAAASVEITLVYHDSLEESCGTWGEK